jgi:hypothetical protein
MYTIFSIFSNFIDLCCTPSLIIGSDGTPGYPGTPYIHVQATEFHLRIGLAGFDDL